MSIAQSLLPEFDNEMATTRNLLALVPDAKNEWKCHEKSFSIGSVAAHLANLPMWTGMTMGGTELDINPPGGSKFESPKFQNTASNLQAFDKNVADARAVLAASSDQDFMVPWSLLNNGVTQLTLPRVAVVRSFVMNHIIHHRGQLSVYLRLLDVPLPSIYGPTADT